MEFLTKAENVGNHLCDDVKQSGDHGVERAANFLSLSLSKRPAGPSKDAPVLYGRH